MQRVCDIHILCVLRALILPLLVILLTLICFVSKVAHAHTEAVTFHILCVFCERALSSLAFIILWILVCLCQQGSPCAHRGRVISYLVCSVCVCTQSAPPRHSLDLDILWQTGSPCAHRVRDISYVVCFARVRSVRPSPLLFGINMLYQQGSPCAHQVRDISYLACI